MAESVLLTKAAAWDYEAEYRLLGRNGSTDPAFSLTTDDDFLELSSGALTAVIAGCDANLEAIRGVVCQCAPNIALRQAIRQPHLYELEIVDVPPVAQ
jgi:hypothetical protein